MSIQQSWQRVRGWVAANAPHITLAGGASAEAIEAAQQAMGLRFPADLVQSYTVQDGVEYGEEEINLIPSGNDLDTMAFCLLPIEQIAEEWQIWKDLLEGGDLGDNEATSDAGIAGVWWSTSWIPVAGNGGGDFICVDLAPAQGGTVGQVILMWHDDDERTLVAPSWEALLAKLADDMEAGRVEYDEDEGVIVV